VGLPGFELEGELGRGGMGIVYAARQRSLNRKVALKVLSPVLASQPRFLARFRNEAAIAAGLVDAHILPVYDILESKGVPVLVLPLIAGADLGKILHHRNRVRHGEAPARPHPWALLDDRAYLDRVLPLLDQVVAAVTAMQAAHVLHRDIKPSNVLVDEQGHPWLSDFGLARFEAHGSGTSPGVVLGTPGYRSPEQARAEVIDGRADLFGLAATLYRALTLELPYGRAGADRTSKPPVPPSRHQPLLSRDFDAVLLKALEPDRDERYDSVAAFGQDWQRVRQGLPPRARPPGPVRRLARVVRRHRWQTAALLAAVALAFLAGALGHGPADPLTTPVADAQTVRVTTDPPQARVVLVPLERTTGAPRPDAALRPAGMTPVVLEHVPAGEYLVVCEVAGRGFQGFHEVYRVVPPPDGVSNTAYRHTAWERRPDGTVELAPVVIPRAGDPGGMALFKGGPFTMGARDVQGSPPHPRSVAAFYLDATEVTIGDCKRFAPDTLPRELAGLDPNLPVSRVTYHAALDYAEKVGKRLPDEAEYEFAATAGGTRPFPWGDKLVRIENWSFGPVREPAFDRLDTQPPVYGLYSNVAEWTTSRLYPYPTDDVLALAGHRNPELRKQFDDGCVVRGGPWSVILGQPTAADLALIGLPNRAALTIGPRSRLSVRRDEAYPGLGFRCARSVKPRFLDP
jgi:formylglycine-generating enzyme required for sulfatase activity